VDEFVIVDNFSGPSVSGGIVALMFDSEFSTADDATVVAAIEEGARAEAAAGARRLAAVEAPLAAQGREVVVVDSAEVDDDLVRDMTEILTSMCARLYGKRAAENRARRALAAAATNDTVLA
jgi:hypothetical protein